MMLGTNERIADEAHMAHDVKELITWHSRPVVAIDVPVVNLYKKTSSIQALREKRNVTVIDSWTPLCVPHFKFL